MLEAYVRRIISESTGFVPQTTIIPVTPVNMFTKKSSPVSVEYSSVKYQKNVVYNAVNKNFTAWFPKITSEVIASMNTSEDYTQFLQDAINTNYQSFGSENTSDGDVSANITQGSVDIWTFKTDPDGTKQAEYASQALIGSSPAVGDIGESLGAEIVIPKYGTSHGYSGQVFDCNDTPFSSNFPSVDLYVGNEAAKAFAPAWDRNSDYTCEGVYVSSKLSSIKSVYVELKEMSLLRLFATIAQGDLGSIYRPTPSHTSGDYWSDHFNNMLGDNCKKLTLKYGFCNGGTSAPTVSLDEPGSSRTGVNPSPAVGIGPVAQRMIISYEASKPKFYMALYRALYEKQGNFTFNDGYYAFTDNGLEPIQSSEADTSNLTLSDFDDNTPVGNNFVTNLTAAGVTARGTIKKAKNSKLKKSFASASSPFWNGFPDPSFCPIADLKTQVDSYIAQVQAWAATAINNTTHLPGLALKAKYARASNKNALIAAAVKSSLDLTLKSLSGLDTTSIVTTPSQELQKMIHMYITDPVDISLEVEDDTKTGNDRTWKLVGSNYTQPINNITNKATLIAGSPVAANSKLGMVFDLACGFSVSGDTAGFIRALAEYSQNTEDFVQKTIIALSDVLVQGLSPFKDVAIPSLALSSLPPGTGGRVTVQPSAKGADPVDIDFDQSFDQLRPEPQEGEDPPTPTPTDLYRKTKGGDQTYLEMATVISSIQKVYTQKMNANKNMSTSQYEQVAVAFKELFMTGLTAMAEFTQLDTATGTKMYSNVSAQTGMTPQIRRLVATKNVAIDYISKTAKLVYNGSNDTEPEVRGALIAAVGVVNEKSFKKYLRDTLNATPPDPAGFGDLMFSVRLEEQYTRYIFRSLLNEMIQEQMLGTSYEQAAPSFLPQQTVQVSPMKVPKEYSDAVISSFKMGLAMIAFAAHINADTEILKFNVETIPSIIFQNEMQHESRLYESILLDLMETVALKQRSENRPKKIKESKQQLNHIVSEIVKKKSKTLLENLSYPAFESGGYSYEELPMPYTAEAIDRLDQIYLFGDYPTKRVGEWLGNYKWNRESRQSVEEATRSILEKIEYFFENNPKARRYVRENLSSTIPMGRQTMTGTMLPIPYDDSYIQIFNSNLRGRGSEAFAMSEGTVWQYMFGGQISPKARLKAVERKEQNRKSGAKSEADFADYLKSTGHYANITVDGRGGRPDVTADGIEFEVGTGPGKSLHLGAIMPKQEPSAKVKRRRAILDDAIKQNDQSYHLTSEQAYSIWINSGSEFLVKGTKGYYVAFSLKDGGEIAGVSVKTLRLDHMMRKPTLYKFSGNYQLKYGSIDWENATPIVFSE